MSIKNNLHKIKSSLPGKVTLIAVTKTRAVDEIKEVIAEGHFDLGENKVQELLAKHPLLPTEVKWHMIGHLQTNKVKQIVPFIHLIHSVDSLKLLKEINKEAGKAGRIVNCLLQIHIAKEETKFGLDFKEAEEIIDSITNFPNVKICGLMGMATNSDNEQLVRNEFKSLKAFFKGLKEKMNSDFNILSMGMSGDYEMAIEEESTMIRVGTAIFGERS